MNIEEQRIRIGQGIDAMRKVLEDGDGTLVVREFDTKAEADAYRQGVEDMDGWLASAFIYDEDMTAIRGLSVNDQNSNDYED